MSVAEEEFEEVDDDIVDEDLNEKESEEGKIKFCYCCSTYTGFNKSRLPAVYHHL